MASIRAEEIGNSIKNAMTNPGGTPLSEITANFVNAFSEAADGFSKLKEKSAELDAVQGNIKDTWIEIELIEEAMEEGVLAVEEGKKKLDELFSQLAVLAEGKFAAMKRYLNRK